MPVIHHLHHGPVFTVEYLCAYKCRKETWYYDSDHDSLSRAVERAEYLVRLGRTVRVVDDSGSTVYRVSG